MVVAPAHFSLYDPLSHVSTCRYSQDRVALGSSATCAATSASLGREYEAATRAAGLGSAAAVAADPLQQLWFQVSLVLCEG